MSCSSKRWKTESGLSSGLTARSRSPRRRRTETCALLDSQVNLERAAGRCLLIMPDGQYDVRGAGEDGTRAIVNAVTAVPSSRLQRG